jgi:hypothetical protein
MTECSYHQPLTDTSPAQAAGLQPVRVGGVLSRL